MKITQVYELLNTVIGEVTGKTDLVAEDLSNVVDVGKEILGSDNMVDAYVKSLVNHIGKVIFVNRVYKGRAPSVLMDGWEYGSILEKIHADLPDSVENESWDLTAGQTYNQDIFNGPKVHTKFFNSKNTYEIDMSFADRQVKQSFSNAVQLNSFFSMIDNRIRTRKTMDYDNLIMRTINNFTAATIRADYAAEALNTKSGFKAVNLLYKYNENKGDANKLTADTCLNNLDFLKYASTQIALYSDRLTDNSQLFNIGGTVKFTPKDLQHIVMLSEFEKAVAVYLQSDTFHEQLVALPGHENVTYWQGPGNDYSFANTSKINVTIKPVDGTSDNVSVVGTGILACIFDRDALGVCNVEDRVTTHYNAKAEFFNNFYKSEAQYFNDYNENFVVFFVA